jgi:HEPN domain-containing protein
MDATMQRMGAISAERAEMAQQTLAEIKNRLVWKEGTVEAQLLDEMAGQYNECRKRARKFMDTANELVESGGYDDVAKVSRAANECEKQAADILRNMGRMIADLTSSADRLMQVYTTARTAEQRNIIQAKRLELQERYLASRLDGPGGEQATDAQLHQIAAGQAEGP